MSHVAVRELELADVIRVSIIVSRGQAEGSPLEPTNAIGASRYWSGLLLIMFLAWSLQDLVQDLAKEHTVDMITSQAS